MSAELPPEVTFDLRYHVTLYDGSDTVYLVVLCKQHYEYDETKQSLVPQRELYQPMIDDWEYETHPERNGRLLAHGRDLWPHKEGVDVIVRGQAYAPDGFPVSRMRVRVAIGGRSKVMDVFGDRCAYRSDRGIKFTEPATFTTMNLDWWNAYGGVDPQWMPKSIDDTPLMVGVPIVELFPGAYPRNPQGLGHIIQKNGFIDGIRLPNIEDPNDLLTVDKLFVDSPEDWWRRPIPQGMGWMSPHAFPRCVHVGYLPYFLPDPELQPRIPEVAAGWIEGRQLDRGLGHVSLSPLITRESAPGMNFAQLEPGTSVEIEGMTSAGFWGFTLPHRPPQVSLLNRNHDRGYPSESRLHTLHIDVETKQVSQLWGTRFALNEDDISGLSEGLDLDALAERYVIHVDRLPLDRRHWPAPRIDEHS